MFVDAPIEPGASTFILVFCIIIGIVTALSLYDADKTKSKKEKPE
ncbi:hypothetical protein OO013_13535 [Mangrovivirga sp. M17]|uniref:Uncharacterized protein n=1 Tax=Mangrovivirga halotolerans TaxID=2993936 RepID=A0ABT3RSZ9_9BACT|nr:MULTISPECIES: hypothetical protein [Mangrovivirga]MCX2744899.1 hypothetical protein [Mangrovivirga halotolerans]